MLRVKTAGFTLVELLLVLGLALIFLLGTSSLFYLAIRSSTKAALQAQGKALVQEGIESVIAIRDLGGAQWDWTTTPINTSAAEYYEPSLSGSVWILGNKAASNPPLPLPSPYQAFTRIVTIESVQRAVACGTSICPIVSSGGIVDNNTRKVVVSVSWSEQDGTHTASLSSYLIRFR